MNVLHSSVLFFKAERKGTRKKWANTAVFFYGERGGEAMFESISGSDQIRLNEKHQLKLKRNNTLNPVNQQSVTGGRSSASWIFRQFFLSNSSSSRDVDMISLSPLRFAPVRFESNQVLVIHSFTLSTSFSSID